MTAFPEIFIAYPWWTLLIAMLTGIVYASLLYVKNSQNKLSRLLTVILFAVRFLIVFFLAFLLLSPTIKTKKKQIEKPIIVVGQDNSRSLLMGRDSANYKDIYVARFSNLITELSVDNDVDVFLFGSNVSEGSVPDYSDNTSGYSDFFNHIEQNYTGLNVGAVIVAGDGIVNSGIDPVFSASNLSYPVYTIAMGDTSQIKDIKIDDLRYNSIVYSGDVFPIEISISSNMLEGEKCTIKLRKNNTVVARKELLVSNNNYRSTFKFNVEAVNAGKQRYSLTIEPHSDEGNLENNSRNIFIDVLESRQKILILANAPHPDVGAIKQSLVKKRNYEVDVEYINDFKNNVEKYDLVILYQLPSKKNTISNLHSSLTNKEIPVLFILGKQSNLPVFNRQFDGMDIISAIGNSVQAQFEYNSSFTYFSFSEELAMQLSLLPPLSAPLANYKVSVGSEIFGWQMINGVITDFPLVTYYNNLGIKTGVISGEGLWLWRIQSYFQFNNTEAVDNFINKTVMFLIADNDRRQFKVRTKGEYDSNQDVIIISELYNQAFELDNSADVELVLTNEDNRRFNYVFSPYDNYYVLNLNKLPVGVYKYNASVKQGNNNYSATGEFVAQQLDYESRNLLADHRMLSRLAEDHNGAMYYPDQIDKLQMDISNLNSLTSKVHYEDKFTGLNSILYVMIVLIILLAFEWFMRKHFGSY